MYCVSNILIRWCCTVTIIAICYGPQQLRIIFISRVFHARSYAHCVNIVQEILTTFEYVKISRLLDKCIIRNKRFIIICLVICIFFFVYAFVGALWCTLLRITFINNNVFLFLLICRTDLQYVFVHQELFWFVIIHRTNTWDQNVFHTSHFCSYRVNVQVEDIRYHHTLRKLYC